MAKSRDQAGKGGIYRLIAYQTLHTVVTKARAQQQAVGCKASDTEQWIVPCIHSSTKNSYHSLREGCALPEKLKDALITAAILIGLCVLYLLYLLYEWVAITIAVIAVLGIVLLGSVDLKRGALTITAILVAGLVLVWLFGM